MTNVARLLVVGEDVILRDALIEQLGPLRDFEVNACSCNGEAAREVLREGRTDLVIMDAGPSATRGWLILRQLREDGFGGPVILLAAAADEAAADEAPEAGPSECLAKPFKFAVLLARIRAQLRARESSEDVAFAIGPYSFRPGAKLLVAPDGERLKLTEKETAILRFLYRADRETVSRDVLLQEVWGYNAAVTTHTLETHVYRLRQKIESDPSAARILVTEPGGYKLLP